MFVTWKLDFVDGYGFGPEAEILNRGGKIQVLMSESSIENGGRILGKIDGDISNLEQFDLVEISDVQAEAFVRANFIESVDYKIEQALALLN